MSNKIAFFSNDMYKVAMSNKIAFFSNDMSKNKQKSTVLEIITAVEKMTGWFRQSYICTCFCQKKAITKKFFLKVINTKTD